MKKQSYWPIKLPINKGNLVFVFFVFFASLAGLSAEAQYCSSTSVSSTIEYISNVNVGAYNNPSGRSNYANYYAAGPIVNTNPGSSFQCLVTITDPITVLDEIYIFCDFNHDNDFNDAGEQAGFSPAPTAGIFTVNVAIPGGAIPGPTYMRIKMGDPDNGTPTMNGDPCQTTFYYGEVEDYQIMVGALTACSGTPAASNTVASINPACPGRDFSLSLSTYYGNLSGISYQWQSSTTAAFTTPTNMGTAPIQIANQTVNTYYRCLITCTGNTIISTPLLVTTSGPCYCIPSGTNSTYYINNFSTTNGISNISNLNSGYAATGYGVFTSMAVSQFAGQAINFSSSFIPSTGTFGFAIWVDWNQDGDFIDGGEQMYNSAAYVSNPTGSFTIPGGTAIGNYRMRICANYWATSPIPCEVGITGEYEDYTLSVLALAACSGSPANSQTIANTTSVCSGNTVNLSLSINYSNLSGITYQWQQSPNGTTFTDISGAISAAYSTAVTSTTYFRCIITCTNGGAQTTSTAVIINVGSPTITGTVGGERCGSGTITLSASGTGNQINWYNSATGGTLLGTGNTFNTPPIAASTTYYAEPQSSATCRGTRVAVTATIRPGISALSINPSSATNCTNNVLAITASGGVSQGTASNVLTEGFNGTSNFRIATTGVTEAYDATNYFEGTQSVRLSYGANANGSYYLNSNLDLTGAASASISFSHICALEGSSTAYDLGTVQYSSDGGATWDDFTPANYSGSGALFNGVASFSTLSYTDWKNNITSTNISNAASLWKTELFSIPATSFTNQFRVRFLIIADGSVQYPGWLIDDIKIVKYAVGSQSPITWSPVTGLYTNAAATTPYIAGGSATTVYAVPAATTTYSASSINAGGCYTSANTVITINGPQLNAVQNVEKCGAGQVTLTASSPTTGSTIYWYTTATGGTPVATGTTYAPTIAANTTYYVSAGAPGSTEIKTFGVGNNVNNSHDVNPYKYSNGSKKTQYMFTAAELSAQGIVNGSVINSISFEIENAGTTLNNFEIRVGETNATQFVNSGGGLFVTPTTSVYTAASITPTTGLNRYIFSTNYTKATNGSLVFQVCWNNNNAGGTPTPRLLFDPTADNMSAYAGANNASACGITSFASRMKRRPKMTIGVVGTTICQGTRYPITATIKPQDTWLGINSNWNDAQNWCPGIPTSSTNVTIPVVGSNIYPILTNGQTAFCNNLTINAGAPYININTGAVMDVKGNFTNNGTLTNNGAIKLTGTIATPQSFPGAAGTIGAMKVLEIGNTGAGIAINRNFTIDSLLKPTRGSLNLGNFDITLRSVNSGTASVSAVTGSISYGSGRFVIERYIKNVGNWNLIASPTAEAQSIYNSWQETNIYTADYGTRITGPNGTAGGPINAAGIDQYSIGYSMKWWDGENTVFKMKGNTVSTATDSLVNKHTGYFLFVRGDRAIGTGAVGAATTLRSRGKLYVGTSGAGGVTPPSISYISLVAGDFISIANPYASPIDPSVLTTSGLKPEYHIWDPTMVGNYQVGQYRAFSATGAWIPTPTPQLPSPYAGLSSYKAIQSGQAFMMEANGTTATVGFKETDKITGSLTFSRDPQNVVMMSTMLHSTNNYVVDGNRVAYDAGHSNAVGNEDAGKIMNSAENFGIVTQNKNLIIEGRKPIIATDTIFYRMGNLRTQNYSLSFEPRNLGGTGLIAELIDKYLNARTPVSLSDSTYYNFAATTDAGSKAADRFMLVFRAPQGPLPVTFVSIAAQRQQDRSIKVNWEVANEVNIEKYEVQRSADGANFTGILTNDATNSRQYSKNDLSPLAEDNFYRIKAVGFAGDITYSNIVKVGAGKQPTFVLVQPNPVKNKQINLRFSNLQTGDYSVQLINNVGQTMHMGNITLNAVDMIKTIKLKSTTAKGVYQLVLINQSGEQVYNQTVIIE